MKKIKLLLAAFAAMVTMGANAQTAADFANGKYVFQNVGSGRYLGPGNSWGTQASLIQFSHYNTLAKLSDGVYSIESQVSNGGKNYYFTGSYMDGAAVNVTITDLGGGIYTMSNGTTYYGYDGSSFVLASNLTDATSANAQWKIIPFDYEYAEATEENPADVTYRILDSNFDRNNRNGAGDNNDLGNKWTMVANNQNLCGGDNTNRCAESWQSAFTLSQQITVPNGYYKLQAQAALTEYTVTGADFPVVYATSGANTVSVPFKTMQNGENSMSAMSTQFTNGNYFTGYTDAITVTNGSLTVGVRGTRTNTWCIWDNFQLVYMGPIDLSAYATELDNAVAAAEAVEGTVPAAAYSQIAAVITANNKTYSTEAEYTAAIDAINSAVSTYASAQMVAAYAYTKKALALYNQSNYSEKVEGAKAEFKAVLDVVEEKATLEEVNTANAAISAALATFMSKVEFEENGYFEITDFFLTNADFSAGNINGWETNYVSGQQANNIGYQGANYTNGDVRISQFIEAWRPGATLGDGYLRQTVSGLPEGKFVLEADAIATWQNDDSREITGAQLFINADGVNYKTDMSTKNGKPQHFSTEFLNTGEGDVQFGLRTVSANCNWLCADNFTVKFYGIDLSPYATLLSQAVAEAEAIDAATITSAAASALAAVVEENNKEWSSSKEYSTAIAAIQAATAAAKAIPVALNSYNATKATVSALTSVEGYTETVDGATSTFNSAISTADTNVAAAATADEVAAQEAALIAAAKTFLGGVRSDGEHAFDITFLIANPNFDNNDIVGWERTFADGTATTRIQCNEFYQATFDFYQTLTDMPKGNYELKVQAFQRPGWAADVYAGYLAGTSKATSVIYINEGETTINHFGAGVIDNVFGHTLNGANLSDLGSGYDVVILDKAGTTMYGPQMMETAALWFSQGYYDNTVLTAVDGDLKLGFKSTAAAAGGDWTIFDNFRLYFYGQSIDVAMSEDEAFAALADIEGANVTMVRNTKKGFNTVALPFDLSADQVVEIFGEGAIVYEYSDGGDDADHVTINFTTKDEQTIEANVPVLVYATKAVNEIAVDDVVVKTGEAKVEGTYFDFVGNYAGQQTLAEGDYFIGNGAVYKSEDPTIHATTIKGFRAYLKAKEEISAGVKLFIDGQAIDYETAVNGIEAAPAQNGAIYNIAGQRVSKAQKGIFIVNGKKVVK